MKGLVHRGGVTAAPEEPLPGQELPANDGRRVEVRARVERLVSDLLRSHVRELPFDLSFARRLKPPRRLGDPERAELDESACSGRNVGLQRNTHQGAKGGPKTVEVSWTAPETTGGWPIQGYRVKVVKASNGKVVKTAWAAASARTASVKVPSGTYRVLVNAKNKSGHGPAAVSWKVVAR